MSRPAAMRPVLQSAAVRAGGFLPTALALLITSRIVISNYGLRTFDSFSLMFAVMAVIPLNDLGVGAAVTTAFAQDGAHSDRAERTTLTAVRTLSASALGLTSISLLLTGFGLWPHLLGSASGPNAFVGAAVIVYALSFVPGLGASMLLGLNRNHIAVAMQSLFAPLTLGFVAIAALGHVDDGWVTLAPSAGMLATQLVTAAVAARRSRAQWGRALRRLLLRRRFRGERIRNLSVPMFITTLTLPIALQSDRIVLSFVSTQRQVADYSVAFQIFAPGVALVAAASQPIWPMYARGLARGAPPPPIARLTALFVIGAVVMCGGLVAISNPVGHLIGGRSMELGILLPVAGALVVVGRALISPLAMTLIDPRGLKVVAACNLLALPANLLLSVYLAHHLGAPGPLLATALVYFLVQTIPLMGYARRRRRRFVQSAAIPAGVELGLDLPRDVSAF